MEDPGLDTKLLVRFLKKSYNAEKPVNITSVDVTSGALKGDNYASIVYRVKFVVLSASGSQRKRSIIVKTIAKWMEAYMDPKSTASPAFRAEIMVYTNILRSMEDLMEEFGDKRNTLWPNLYGSTPYNMIAFEDLTESLYTVSPRNNRIDSKQALLVLRNLGRFHAMGKVLISRGLISQEDKGQLFLALDNEFAMKYWAAYFSVTSSGVKTWGAEWKEIADKLSHLGTSGVNKIWGKLAENYDKRYEVLNHGDLWNCNLMFQNLEFEDIPVSVKFVDYQCTHLNSFIWDIQYFLHTSVIPSVRKANLKLLLTAYQESLETNLKFFNYDGYVPTIEDVEAEAKRLEFVGMCCLMFQPIMMSDTQLNLDKIMTHPPEDVIEKSIFTDGKAREEIGEDFKHFYANGVMDFGK